MITFCLADQTDDDVLKQCSGDEVSGRSRIRGDSHVQQRAQTARECHMMQASVDQGVSPLGHVDHQVYSQQQLHTSSPLSSILLVTVHYRSLYLFRAHLPLRDSLLSHNESQLAQPALRR